MLDYRVYPIIKTKFRPVLRPRKDLADIIEQSVCKTFNVSMKELKSKDRYRKYVTPRHICFLLERRLAAMTTPDIGKRFNRHHTTVITGGRTIEGVMQFDKSLSEKYKEVLLLIG